ncbi:MAG TPA: hypothetical protein VGF76_05345, partial [Polyangiaceae bacterium]
MNIPSIKSDRTGALLAGLGLAGIAACGVTDHPHPQPMHDTTNDFGPSGGTPAVTIAGAPAVVMAGAPATGGAPGFGGAPTEAGGTSLGGTSTGGTSTAGAATGGAS